MAPMLGWYPGCLAYRQRVKRFRQFRAAVRSSAVGRDRWLDRSWFRSAQNRLTRVPLGQPRAAVRSSAWGATGDLVQRAVARKQYGSGVERVPGVPSLSATG